MLGESTLKKSFEEIIGTVKKHENIFIYGAGMVSDLAFILLQQKALDDRIKAFVITEPKRNAKTKKGKPVIGFDSFISSWYGRDFFVLIAVGDAVREEIELQLNRKEITNYIIFHENVIKENLYSQLYMDPILDNKIVFMNNSGLGFRDNPKYIAEEILKRDTERKYDLVWAVKSEEYIFPEGVRKVLIGTLDYYREMATARIWIDTNRKTADIIKRKGQIYIQAWHGAAPIKRVEKDASSKLSATYITNAQRDSEMADLFLSGSRFYTNLYRRSFWYDGEILEVGLPRQDVFWRQNEARRKIRGCFNIPKESFVALYAPTFRNAMTNEVYDLNIDMIKSALKKRFGKDFVFFVSKHPSNKSKIKYPFENESNYIDVASYDDFEEILVTADVLISDYSGCVYDYSFTGRPVFLYQKDYNDYLKERDFYIPMADLPYISACSNYELSKKIIAFDQEAYVAKLNEFMQYMGNYDTGKASEKVVDWIVSKTGIEI